MFIGIQHTFAERVRQGAYCFPFCLVHQCYLRYSHLLHTVVAIVSVHHLPHHFTPWCTFSPLITSIITTLIPLVSFSLAFMVQSPFCALIFLHPLFFARNANHRQSVLTLICNTRGRDYGGSPKCVTTSDGIQKSLHAIAKGDPQKIEGETKVGVITVPSFWRNLHTNGRLVVTTLYILTKGCFHRSRLQVFTGGNPGGESTVYRRRCSCTCITWSRYHLGTSVLLLEMGFKKNHRVR